MPLEPETDPPTLTLDVGPLAYNPGMTSPEPLVQIDAPTLQERVGELGKEIAIHFEGRDLHVLCVLQGAVLFFADLIRHLPGSITTDFLQLASYGSGTVSSGEVQLVRDLTLPVQGRHVLVVEDIVDTGLTLAALGAVLEPRGPASLSVCSLLYKGKGAPRPAFVGFEVDPDHFVVGYGLDAAGLYRNLPYIGLLSPAE